MLLERSPDGTTNVIRVVYSTGQAIRAFTVSSSSTGLFCFIVTTMHYSFWIIKLVLCDFSVFSCRLCWSHSDCWTVWSWCFSDIYLPCNEYVTDALLSADRFLIIFSFDKTKFISDDFSLHPVCLQCTYEYCAFVCWCSFIRVFVVVVVVVNEGRDCSVP